MLRLLLTADYEVFGDGSGCVRRCVIDPTELLLATCEQRDCRVTLFVDVCEYWKFREVEETGGFADGSTPATWMAGQLCDAVRRGHDVQLHAHPQWLAATWDRGRWRLSMQYWRLPEVGSDAPMGIVELLRRGKETLEELLRPVRPDYACRAFRAGAWCIQPEAEVVAAMRDAGLTIDTSVAPGLSATGELTRFDFSAAPLGRSHWPISDSVTSAAASSEIHEVPIYTRPSPLLVRLRAALGRCLLAVPKRPPDCDPALRTRADLKIQGRREMFDFCSRTSMDMRSFVHAAALELRAEVDGVVPLVAIGHPKSFGNHENLGAFLEWARCSRIVELDRLTEPSFWQTAFGRAACPAR